MTALVVLPNGHYALNNNEVYTIPLTYDVGGVATPRPAGDVASVATTGAFAASLGAAMSSDGASVVLNALVVESDAGNSGGGIGLALTDSNGDAMDAMTAGLMFDIVAPPAAPTEGLDITNITTAPQPTPTAPGP